MDVSVRTMTEGDLMEARRIFRMAFGTFIGVPDPENFWADREYIFTRWRADPSAALVAEADGAVAGSNFATRWGSFAFFGPLTVRPDLWNQHVAQKLLGSTMDLFDRWGVRDAGLFTFSNSPQHVALYQKFGFWPRFLTAILSKDVKAREASSVHYSTLSAAQQAEAAAECRKLTHAIYGGLDVSREILAVRDQRMGETVLLWGGDSLDAFAVCHGGEGTEAGTGNCFIKFAAVRPGPGVEKGFDALLDGCEALAAEHGWHHLHAGVNLNRSQAYRQILKRGFRTNTLGVAMQRFDSPAYNRPDVFVLDDWR